MANVEKTAKNLAQAATKVVEALTPMSSDERLRTVRAALELLGESTKAAFDGNPAQSKTGGGQDKDRVAGISDQGNSWMQRTNVTTENLEHYFDLGDGAVKVIGIPASVTTVPEKVITTYLLVGLASLLAGGDPSFTDDTARERCRHFGCFDGGNHAKYVKAFGNRMTGSKTTGWKVTAPGLNEIAAKIRQ